MEEGQGKTITKRGLLVIEHVANIWNMAHSMKSVHEKCCLVEC